MVEKHSHRRDPRNETAVSIALRRSIGASQRNKNGTLNIKELLYGIITFDKPLCRLNMSQTSYDKVNRYLKYNGIKSWDHLEKLLSTEQNEFIVVGSNEIGQIMVSKETVRTVYDHIIRKRVWYKN